ncbi:30S ribosomal protein S9 [Candidatus Babeliales bacterium]|nr:30S ribosomal protein S9 [Candidatus Babeliales bacterium]
MIKAKKTTEKATSKTVAKKTVKKTAVKKAVSEKVLEKKVVKKDAPQAASVREVVKTAPVAERKIITKIPVAPAAPVKKGTKVVSSSIGGVGRRKSSVARVWLSRGKGEIFINDRALNNYFDTTQTRINAVQALSVCNAKDKFTIKVRIVGGGPCSQSDAVKLGIARALLKSDESHRIILREHGLLTVDARVKERKKPGQPGARRKFQFVKR